MPSNQNNNGNVVAQAVSDLNEILQDWEVDNLAGNTDPTRILLRLCELFELHITNFLKRDPDPFDERHPISANPDGALGHILKVLFKKESFVNKLLNSYLHDNYLQTQGVSNDSTELNTASCRLLLDLQYGLDVPQIFRETDESVDKLFTWAEKAPEPLRTYATGLLSAAVDVREVAASFRDHNAHLLPIMLNRLWDLKDEGGGDEVSSCITETLPARPFAHLNSEGSHNDASEVGKESQQLFTLASSELNLIYNSDCSNSSWAEMSSYIVGSHQMYPINRDVKVMFILKYLRPVCEYQESLGNVFQYKAIELIFHYINMRKTCNARLSFEALRVLGSLLFHKKFCIEFVLRGGVEKLLQVPRPSLPTDGVALCLWYLGFCEEAVERICALPDPLLNNLIKYALWLIESGHPSARTHSVMFFGLVFRFRTILDRFDRQDGLRKLVNIISTMSILQELNSDDEESESSDDSSKTMMWQMLKHVCLSLRNYFEAHLAIRAHHHSHPPAALSGNATGGVRTLSVSWESVIRNCENLLENLPANARWDAVETFLKLNGVSLFLQIVAVVLEDSFGPHRVEAATSALDTLYICSVMPAVQSMFCKKIVIPAGEEHSILESNTPIEAPGYSVLVSCIPEKNGHPVYAPELQKSALNVLVNCLCTPLQRQSVSLYRSFETTSRRSNPGALSTAREEDLSDAGRSVATLGHVNKRMKTTDSAPSTVDPVVGSSSQTCEEIVKKSWDCVRRSNGIMHLLSLLDKKLPITDADRVRAQACRALVGLSRSEAARQIMSKLCLFTQGHLQLLMREPILQEKRLDHVNFQRYSLELINTISGKCDVNSTVSSRSNVIPYSTASAAKHGALTSASAATSTDISLLSIHKADVVAQTRINYNKVQLLQLIQLYLAREGLHKAAEVLQAEACLPDLPQSSSMPPPVSLISPTPGASSRSRLTPRSIFSPHVGITRAALPSTNSTLGNRNNRSDGPVSSNSRSVFRSVGIGAGLQGTPTPLSIRSSRGVKRSVEGTVLSSVDATHTSNGSISSSFEKSELSTPVNSSCDASLLTTSRPGFVRSSSTSYRGLSVATCGVSLDGIVREYLTNQHALCQNPVVTCPTFDLFQPHRCPEPRCNRLTSAYNNIAHRLLHRSYYTPRYMLMAPPSSTATGRLRQHPSLHSHGNIVAHTLPSLDRRFIYSRYRPSNIFRPSSASDDGTSLSFTTVKFTTDDRGILVGDANGKIAYHNIWETEDTDELVFDAHHNGVTHLAVHKMGRTLLSSCATDAECILWSNCNEFANTPEMGFIMSECQHAIFNNAQDKILTTFDFEASLHDINTKQIVQTFKPKLSNRYLSNHADMHPHDDVILTDGVLFDVRSGKEIHKFDKLNSLINGKFHINGLEVISSSEVWDMRTYHLLRSVPALNRCNVFFNRGRDIIFGISDYSSYLEEWKELDTSFKVVDAVNYYSIVTFDTRRVVLSLDICHTDSRLAVVESDDTENVENESFVRLYDVGMVKQQEDNDPMSDEDEEDGVDLNTDDSSDTDSESDSNDSDDSHPPDDNQDGDDDDNENGQGDDDDIIIVDDIDEGSSNSGIYSNDNSRSSDDNRPLSHDGDSSHSDSFNALFEAELSRRERGFRGRRRRVGARTRARTASTRSRQRTAVGIASVAAEPSSSQNIGWSREHLVQAMASNLNGRESLFGNAPAATATEECAAVASAEARAPHTDSPEPMDQTDDAWEDLSGSVSDNSVEEEL